MKTPREILFQKHRANEPKLDAVCREVVSQLNARPSAGLASALLNFQRNFWREVIWPARRIWAGLAAVWALILLADLDFRASAPQLAATASANSDGFLISPREQEQRMAEFTARPAPIKPDQPIPRDAQPRSERRVLFLIG